MTSMSLRAFGIVCAAVSTQVFAAPAIAHAVTAQAASSTSSARALALQLSQTAQPADLLVEAVLKGYDEGFSEEQANSETAEIEREFPGYLEKLRLRGRIELEKVMREHAPVLQRRTADVYAADVSEEHMRNAIAFLRTPTGAKMLRGVTLAPSDTGSANDLNLTVEEVATEARAAALHSVKQLTGAERVELMKFAASPAGVAFRDTDHKITPIVAETMNEVMAEFAERIDPIAVELLQGYIGGSE